MTRREIRTKIIQRLREQTTPVGWSVAEINEYIDDGYVDIAEMTKSVVDNRTLTLVAGQNFVALPTDIICPFDFKDQATGLPIDPVDWEWVDNRDSHWIRNPRSRPTYVFSFGTHELGFYPHYSTGGVVEYTAAITPPAITQDATVPDIQGDFHFALIHYALHRCLLKDALTPDRLHRALRHKRNYKEALGDLDTLQLKRLANLHTANHRQRLRTPSSITEGS